MTNQRIDEEYAGAHRRPHHNGQALPNPKTELLAMGEIMSILNLPIEDELMFALMQNPSLLRGGR